MELFYPSLVGFFFLFVTFSLQFLFYKQQKAAGENLPPGRTGFPIIGESLEFLSTGWKGHPEKFIFDRIAKYSSYVFRTSLLGSPAVVFCGSAGNKFLFSNENKLVQAWWPSSVDKIFPSSTQTSSKEEAIKLRKMLPKFLKPEALQGYIGLMDQIAQRHFATDWENKDQVVVFPLTKRYTFWLACRVFVSVEDPIHVAKFEDPFGVLATGILSVPINLPGTPFNRGIKASNFIRKELVTIIKQRKIDLAQGKASPTQDILSHMLLTSDEDGKFMQEGDIADKILGLLVGGHDTASSSCASIIKYLAELHSTHRNPEFFPEPLKFDPSRFDGSGPAPYTFVPFGGGPRMCPGKEYARLEILVFMHHLVRRFKWEMMIPNENIVSDPMPNPEKGLPIRLYPHTKA